MLKRSLYHFLHQLIDYAGLFPPASLSLERSLANYRVYLDADFSWMVGRFVCPVSGLEEAADLWKAWEVAHPLRLSVLCGAPLDPGFSAQLELIQRMQHSHCRPEALELRLSAAAEPGDAIPDQLKILQAALQENPLPVFVEAPGMSPELVVSELAGAAGSLGFKLRCGGVEASAFPDLSRVTEVLKACLAFRVPFKATAGLHHPIRHRHPQLEIMSHGFVNIFAGGMLAALHPSGEGLLEQCLEEEDGTRFLFGEHGLHYDRYEISNTEIQALRSDLLTSFGSCSLSEPVEDLRSLGWIRDSIYPSPGETHHGD